jgi:hypothetical protein
MSSAATDDDVPADSIATTSEDKCLSRKCEDHDRQGDLSALAAGGGPVRL